MDCVRTAGRNQRCKHVAISTNRGRSKGTTYGRMHGHGAAYLLLSHVCSTKVRLPRRMERGDPASDVDVGQEKFDWIGWARDDRQNRGDDGDATEHGDEEHSDDENDQHLWSVFKGHQAELLRQLSWAPRGLREVNMPGA